MAAILQGLGYDGRGDLVLITPNPHPSFGRVEVCNKLEHHNGWVAREDVEMVASDCLTHHPICHLVLKKALIPTELPSIHLCESLKLCFGGELVSLWVVFIEDLGKFV